MTIRDERLAPWPRTRRTSAGNWPIIMPASPSWTPKSNAVLEALKAAGHDSRHAYRLLPATRALPSAATVSMGKQNLYEDAMRVPLPHRRAGFAPGHALGRPLLPVGHLSRRSATFPACPPPAGSEGASLGPVLWGRTNALRSTLLTAYRNVQRAVRNDRWKLIRYPQVDQTQLFDLQANPNELHDLAGKPEHAAQLAGMTALPQASDAPIRRYAPLKVPNPRPADWTPPKTGGPGQSP